MSEMQQKFLTIFRSSSMPRLAVMGAVALATLAALAFVALRGGGEPMGYLYTDMEPASAQAVVEKLQAQQIDYQIADGGTAIMAPRSRLAELRMAMEGEGLEGAIGYEILDKEQGFGLSSAREKLNATRALEGELAKSIGTLSTVSSARVHIVMPERAPFAREGRKASAAVTVKASGQLSDENVQAIRNLVAASVPELSAEQVSVIDQKGRLLARAGDGSTNGGGNADQRQSEIEARLRTEVETLLEPIVGPGKVRAEVSAEIDRSTLREEARSFDPEKQVIARQITVESGNQNSEGRDGPGTASVGAQLPLADRSGGEGQTSASSSNETSEDITYDNSRIDRTVMQAPGALKRLSVAVMIDSAARAMKPEELQRLTRLVEGAVGFDAERGDSVVVDSMAFATPAPEEGPITSLLESIPTGSLFDIAKLAIILGAGLLLLRVLKGGQQGKADASPPLLAPAADMASLPGGTQNDAADEESDQALRIGRAGSAAQLDHEIALAQVEGGIKASSLRRIGETVSSHPGESASVIRQWMSA